MADQKTPVYSPWPSAVAGARKMIEPNNQDATSTPEGGIGLGIHNMPQQADLYLRLSQVLECEIWQHNETRAALSAEEARRQELEQHLQHQMYQVAQWEDACRTTYAALDNHRGEFAKLRFELEKVSAELAQARQNAATEAQRATAPGGDLSKALFQESTVAAEQCICDECERKSEPWQMEVVEDFVPNSGYSSV